MLSIENYCSTTAQKEILRQIYIHSNITRKELCELTGISGRSVVKYVSEFIEKGIVVECGKNESTGGRNAMQLSINPDFLLVLAVDIGSYVTKIGVVNVKGEIIKEEFIRTKTNKLESIVTPELLREILSKILDEYGRERFAGLGMSVTGIVNNEKKYINFSPNIPKFTNVDVVKMFEEPLSIPTSLDTSARCLALAEQRYGYGNGYKNQIFVSVGHSVSAGIIINDRLFSGSSGIAGEIGHAKCGNDGVRCTCGNYDCLELYATLPMIVSSVKRNVSDFSGYSPSAELVKDISDFTWEHVKKGIELKDRLVLECVEGAGERLGFAVSHLVNALNPDIVVFGGSVTELIPEVVDCAIKTVNSLGLISCVQNLELKKSVLSNKAAIMGSALMVMNNFFGV